MSIQKFKAETEIWEIQCKRQFIRENSRENATEITKFNRETNFKIEGE